MTDRGLLAAVLAFLGFLGMIAGTDYWGWFLFFAFLVYF